MAQLICKGIGQYVKALAGYMGSTGSSMAKVDDRSIVVQSGEEVRSTLGFDLCDFWFCTFPEEDRSSTSF